MSGTVLVLAAPFSDHEPEASRPLVEADMDVVAGADCADEAAVIEALRGYDASVASMEPYTRAVFEALPDLKVVSR